MCYRSAVRSALRKRGARGQICYSAVHLNGIVVYDGQDGDTLFDIDQLNPNEILAIECFPSASQIPAQFSRTTTGKCGLLLIWTK
jgi:hypothetical protein